MESQLFLGVRNGLEDGGTNFYIKPADRRTWCLDARVSMICIVREMVTQISLYNLLMNR